MPSNLLLGNAAPAATDGLAREAMVAMGELVRRWAEETRWGTRLLRSKDLTSVGLDGVLGLGVSLRELFFTKRLADGERAWIRG